LQYLVGVDFDSPLSNQIPEELAGSYSKGALLRIELHVVFSEESRCFLQIMYMVQALETLHEHVVDIYLHCVPDQLLKTLLTIHWKVASAFFNPKGITL